MTTIAYRNGIMACDSRAYAGDATPVGSKCKIIELHDGTLIGVSSTKPGGGEAIRRWYIEGMPKEPEFAIPESFEVLIAKLNGEIFFGTDNLMLSGPVMGEYFAIGSGSRYALGAMATGCSAEEAVKIACELDVWSSEPIYSLTHKPKHERLFK